MRKRPESAAVDIQPNDTRGSAATARALGTAMLDAADALDHAAASGNADVLRSYEWFVERIERARVAWETVGPIKGETWQAIAAEKLLDDGHARLDGKSGKRARSVVARRIRRAVAADVAGLARVSSKAWADALAGWHEKKRGRPTKGGKSRSGILFSLLKSAKLAAGVTSAKNLADSIARALRSK